MGGPGNTWRRLNFLRLTALTLQAQGLTETSCQLLSYTRPGKYILPYLMAINLRRSTFFCQQSTIAQIFVPRFVAGGAEDEDSKEQNPVSCARLWIVNLDKRLEVLDSQVADQWREVQDLGLYVAYGPDLRPEQPVL
ncbi:hypothetical protein ARMSODRAFT_950504 [Armillaria solidipes]|uniref:Uncharacterized protein n=1 Tax=Armillaria solidipes TaxID=1076256 RepID=A0A2H3CH70_9AGAR|nr:hypothetical protein ARMSODRAFT_950504 [Armillaria solidipes]